MRVEPCNASAVITVTATSVVCSTNCIIQSLYLNPGSGASVINVYDPAGQGVTTSTNATLVLKLIGVANGSSVCLPISGSGVELKNGCLIEITGTAATGGVTFAKIGG